LRWRRGKSDADRNLNKCKNAGFKDIVTVYTRQTKLSPRTQTGFAKGGERRQ
jgi:hypothetical protein